MKPASFCRNRSGLRGCCANAASRSTSTRPRRSGNFRSTCGFSAATAWPFPPTSCTDPRASASSISGNRSGSGPLLTGGGQQRGLRAGTLNVPGIAGLGKAAELVRFPSSAPRDRFEACLACSGIPHRIAGTGHARLPQTCCVLFPGQDGMKLVALLGEAGVAVSSGSACSSGGLSRILLAAGADPGRGRRSAPRLLRASLNCPRGRNRRGHHP